MEQVVKSLDELASSARSFVAALSKSTNSATLVALSGELGAGKTAFVQEIARVLGVEETVTSPTFVLEKIYLLPKSSAFTRLVHIDAYRLESGKELIPLGFDELMQDSGNLILLEWPEKVADMFPEPSARISMRALSGGVHSIYYD